MSARARACWARTKLHVWPERYWLVSLAPALLAEAAALLSQSAGSFAALELERDEVSLTLRDELWRGSWLQSQARAEEGPYRAITFDVDLDLELTGYLAPAAQRLADAGVSIVPQCGFLKDHVLVRESHLEAAVQALEALIAESR